MLTLISHAWGLKFSTREGNIEKTVKLSTVSKLKKTRPYNLILVHTHVFQDVRQMILINLFFRLKLSLILMEIFSVA